jgi:aspartate dehydrogenase
VLEKKLGLIGYGTIGRHVAKMVDSDPSLDLSFIVDAYYTGKETLEAPLFGRLEKDMLAGIDIVVETANADVVKEYARTILASSDFLIFSVTALADADLFNDLLSLSMESGKRILIPHGAILGLDGIRDGRDAIDSVRIITSKNPKGFGRTDTVKTVIYEGSTREACLAYPKNVNVHAATALAGLGFDRTISTIVSDPDLTANTHEILVEGKGFNFHIKVSSTSQGLVTGVYTPLSACGSLARITSDTSGILFV